MILSTELILNVDGSVYHLNLLPHQIADKIIFVGDQNRVPKVATFFDSIEFQAQKREFHTTTGVYKGQRLTVISTGIGTDNIDIVMNELDALVNIDLANRVVKPKLEKLKVLRLGTCGGLQKEHLPGTIIHSRYAIGMDRLLDFYMYERNELDEKLRSFLAPTSLKYILPYTAQSCESFQNVLKNTQIVQGITLTNQGFYGPQGRSLQRIPIQFPTILDTLADFEYDGFQVLNLEMETAAILALGGLLGHECASLSVILANRPLGLFSENPTKHIENLIEKGLEFMLNWK